MKLSPQYKCLLASTSTLHNQTYLAYLLPELEVFFKEANHVLFIPYARPGGISHDEYTAKANAAFAKIEKTCVGLHTYKNPIEAIQNAEAIFTGGGNTFVLLNQLYQLNLVGVLQEELKKGKPYLGTSAGTNICGLSIKTTNDMPIVYPPSFDALGSIPFVINPHYLDPVVGSKHMGESRETRIKEFKIHNTETVIGLREGSWLQVEKTSVILKGKPSARLFYKNTIEEVASGFDFKCINR